MTLPSSGPLSLSDIQGEFGGSNPIGINEYYAGGGLVPSGTTGTYGAVPTSGQISIQNFYGTSNYIPVYIEDLFCTQIYLGNGSTQTITNNINLSSNGGAVWFKRRDGAENHEIYDTARGVGNRILPNTTFEQFSGGTLSAFNSNGFSMSAGGNTNQSGMTYASWTFRKQPKFFDVVTYTGNGANRTIAHNLGSVPGCIIVKNLSARPTNWQVYHRGLTSAAYGVQLNSTNAQATDSTLWNSTAPTSSVFSLGTNNDVNTSGYDYVAYLFAHNAGGFGLTGSDNIISCGVATMPGAGGSVTVNLGYEPQWILWKDRNHSGGYWWIFDNMRGYAVPDGSANGAGGNAKVLFANTDGAENTYTYGGLTSTGFVIPSNFNYSDNNTDIIYVAIRRGPMKIPTDATKVFYPRGAYSDSNNQAQTYGMSYADMSWLRYLYQAGGVASNGQIAVSDRLRSNGTTGAYDLITLSTSTEAQAVNALYVTNISPIRNGYVGTNTLGTGNDGAFWFFQRSPSFFDIVGYSGTGAAQYVNHNLGTSPQLMFFKSRNAAGTWLTYSATTGNNAYLRLETSDASTSTGGTQLFGTSSTQFYIYSGFSASANVYVAYLFASCPGVSKVSSYSGTGATQTISCGFAARFVMIKRTDSTGNWWFWDTARGMVSGSDFRLTLNDNSVELNNNWVYTDASGFQIVTTDASVNASGGTYIYLAIA